MRRRPKSFVSVGFDLTHSFQFEFNAGLSNWRMVINSDNTSVFFSINLVALYLIFHINELQKRVIKLETVRSIAELGKEQQDRPLTPL